MPRINSALSCPGRKWKPGTRDKKIRQHEFDYEPDVLTAAKIRHAVDLLKKASDNPKDKVILLPIHPDAYADYISFSDLDI